MCGFNATVRLYPLRRYLTDNISWDLYIVGRFHESKTQHEKQLRLDFG